MADARQAPMTTVSADPVLKNQVTAIDAGLDAVADGAVVGGYLFNVFGAHGVTGVNLYSLFVAVVGAVVVLVLYHAIRRV